MQMEPSRVIQNLLIGVDHSKAIFECGTTHCVFIPIPYDTGSATQTIYLSSIAVDVDPKWTFAICQEAAPQSGFVTLTFDTTERGPVTLVALGQSFTVLGTDTQLYGCGRSESGQLTFQTKASALYRS